MISQPENEVFVTAAEGHHRRDPIIRRALSSDICTFVNICRMAFPGNVRWQSFRSLARRWWQTALTSSGTETWIAEVDNKVLAMCLLVTDEAQWTQDKAHRSESSVLRFIAAASCPVLTGAKVLRAMKDKMDSHQVQPLTLPDRPSETRTWIELIAVCARHRGRGLAKCLLRHCEARTKALGKQAISLRVHKSNQAARGLYKAMGYQEVNVSGVDIVYSKPVSCSSEPSFERCAGSGL